MKIKEYIKLLQNNNVPFEKQEEALVEIEKAIKEAKQKKEELANKNADLIVSAFKQIEDKLNKKFEELLNTPAMKGEKGDKGDKGDTGPAGKDGIVGRDGKDGANGKDGVDGKDGVSVIDAYIDFDGSLVIKLSDGNEIDAGKVVAEAVAKEFNAFMTRGEILPLQDGNAGKYLTTNGDTLSWASLSSTTAIGYLIDGGGDVITTGELKPGLRVPFSGTIESVTLLADQTGSIVVDIWKDSYANYPPTVADSICGSAKPTLSSAIKSEDTTLTGWTKTIAVGDILLFNVDSATTVQQVTVILKVTKT